MEILEQKLKNFVNHYKMVEKNRSLLLAVSGGIDSMVMLELFLRLKKNMKLRLSVVHVNHRLRGKESDGDERFVRKISRLKELPCYVSGVDVKSYALRSGLSVQAAARHLRYERIERIRRRIGAKAVATGHHADDNAETIILNILRGTGLHGLAGIPPVRKEGCIIRPLLFATREEIKDFADRNGIAYREDSSNVSLKYERNFLRCSVFPELVKRTPDMIRKLNQVAVIAFDVNGKLGRIVDRSVSALLRRDAAGRRLLDIKGFADRPEFLRSEILMSVLNGMGIEPTEKKIEALAGLCGLPVGRRVQLNGHWSAYRDRKKIALVEEPGTISEIKRIKQGESCVYNRYKISIGRPGPVPAAYGRDRFYEYVDAGKLSRSLIVRSWRRGDWFVPLGMRQRKKVSDFFADQKIPLFQKTRLPILESAGKIVWICTKRLDERFRLTDRTKRAVRISCNGQD